VANLLPFLAWVPVVHARFLKGMHLTWLGKDICLIVLWPTLMAALILQVIEWPSQRTELLLALLLVYATLALVAVGSSSTVRGWCGRRLAVRAA
jgi:hypothetical protein